MRIFVGILGGLFLIIAIAGGFSAAGVIAITDGDHSGDSWTCQSSTGSSTLSCSWEYDSNPNDTAIGTTAGLAVAIGAAAFFVGGCALLGGAVAGGRKQPVAAPQPVAAGGPPNYGGGWSGGSPQPPTGNDQPRS